MLLVFAGILALISLGLCAVQFFIRLRRLDAVASTRRAEGPPARYRPMLRLLSDDDIAFLSSNKPLLKKVRRQRSEIFRGYLSCLAKDYGRLLAGVRLAMVGSAVDRPELTRLLAKNRILFAVALCRIECRLWLYDAGMGKVDVSGLVEAMELLKAQIGVLTPSPLPAF